MKSFVPHFNLSVLNTNLKSGIWTGLTAVSAASGVLTVYAHWNEIEEKTTTVYEYIQNNYFTPVYDYFKSGAEAIANVLWQWYETVSSFLEKIYENLEFSKWLEGLQTVWEKSLEYLQTVFEFLKSFLNPESFTEKNIRTIIAAVTNVLKFTWEVIVQLIQQSEEANKLLENLKQLLQHDQIWDIVYNLGKVLFNYPEVLSHIDKDDIAEALEFTMTNTDDFLENAEKLEGDPIVGKEGEELKDELKIRLFAVKGCKLSLSLDSAKCILDATLQGILNDVTKCKEEGQCNEQHAGEFYTQTTKAVYEGVSGAIKSTYENHLKPEKLQGYGSTLISGLTNWFNQEFGIDQSAGQASNAATTPIPASSVPQESQ